MSFKKPSKSAVEKVMDLLARRDHSELELRQKMRLSYSDAEISHAIENARTHGWLKSPEELAEIVGRQLARRHKGARYVRRYLAERGLPSLQVSADEQLAQARELVALKIDDEPPYSQDVQKKIARLLTNRGFEDSIIRKVIYEKP